MLVWMGALTLFSCEKDNYTQPKSQLTGRVVYNGEPINVEYNQVRLQLWQPGFGKLAAIDSPIKPDGSFSSTLFDGRYKLVFPANRGPFKTVVKDATAKDTVFVDLKGNQSLDIEVRPYYMIRNVAVTGGEKKVNAAFSLEKVITGTEGREIERISLYINKSEFVARAFNIAAINLSGTTLPALTGTINVSVNVPDIKPAQNYVYAVVGVKIAGVEDMIFSPAQKVNY